MGHGADLSKMRPPVGFKNTSSIHGVEPSVLNVSREQSEVCKLCLQNQRIKIDDLLASVLKKDPDFKAKVKEANKPCCATQVVDDKVRYICRTYARLMKAYAANAQSQGMTIDTCVNCPKHIDNDAMGHGMKPCLGRCVNKPIERKVGKW
jgi:hypothetical protein